MPPNSDSSNQATALQITLEEFKVLREEIQNRSSAQHTLINLNLTAIGTIGGFAIAYHTSPLVLLILPPLSAALGLLYIDHAGNISRLGWYIREKLWPSLQQMVSTTRLPTYEQEVAVFERRTILRIGYGIPFFFMFSGPPIFALVFTYQSLGPAWTIALWVIGLLLLLDLVFSWWAFIIQPVVRKPRTRAPTHSA